MKIAFVGKGGSGKSTVTSLFIKHLINKKEKVLVVDADINMHMAGLIGVSIKPKREISEHENPKKIRKILIGNNKRIKSIDHFVKTTPPATGSHLVTLEKVNPIINNYATSFSESGYLMSVGTYSEDEIGIACYHTNLSILENILSHTLEKEDEWIIVDMVAGTDAFSGSLHIQFDAIFLIVEPTPESTSVFTQYKKLAEKAGVFDHIFVIGNKIQDEVDVDYVREIVGDKLIGYIPVLSSLKRARQQNRSVELSDIADRLVFKQAENIAKNHLESHGSRLKKLYELHKKHAQEEWVVSTLGDVTDQIDPSFQQ